MTALPDAADSRYEALWRFPNRSKRWASGGVFATAAAAAAAIDGALAGRRDRAVDRWVRRLPAAAAVGRPASQDSGG